MLEELLKYGKEQLKDCVMDPELDAWYLMEFVFQIDRSTFFLNPVVPVSEEQAARYKMLIRKRAEHIPLQHLTGVQEFMGIEFVVNEKVLIPRQDTECLVEEAEKYLKSGMSVLDMCTGSGCILISLVKRIAGIAGTGVDISEEALTVAEENAKRQQVQVKFQKSDLFAAVDGRFDLIVSNPPYIRTAELAGLMPEVKDYDPLLALDGKEDGLFFYKRITRESHMYLKQGGFLLLEIGYDQGHEVYDMLKENNFMNIEIIKDLAGNDRVVKAQYCQEEP